MSELTGNWASRSEIDDEIRKSAAAGERLVKTTCIRRTLTSRDSMSTAERFAKGNIAYGMTSEFVEVWTDQGALRAVREMLQRSNPAAAIALDCGRIFESDLMKALAEAGVTVGTGAAEPEPALEPLRKSEPAPHARKIEPGAYPSLRVEEIIMSAEQMRKSEAQDIVEVAYDSAVKDGRITRRTADDALSRLVDQIRKGQV